MTGKKLQESRALHGWGLLQTVGDRAEVSLGEPGNLAGYSGSVQSPGLHLSDCQVSALDEAVVKACLLWRPGYIQWLTAKFIVKHPRSVIKASVSMT